MFFGFVIVYIIGGVVWLGRLVMFGSWNKYIKEWNILNLGWRVLENVLKCNCLGKVNIIS